jgi:hypothetical protein
VTGDAVTEQHSASFRFEGGRTIKVEINIGDDVNIDLEQHPAAAPA